MPKFAPSDPPRASTFFAIMHCSSFESDDFSKIYSDQDAAAFRYVVSQIEHKVIETRENPVMSEVERWCREVGAKLESGQLLVCFVSTHGFEYQGEIHLCLRDSQRNDISTMLPVSKWVRFFDEHFSKGGKGVFFLQSCRTLWNTLEDAEEHSEEHSDELPKGAFILCAVESGKEAQGGAPTKYHIRELIAAGRFTRDLLREWKRLKRRECLVAFAERLGFCPYKNKARESFFLPLLPRPTPPKEFIDRRFEVIESRDALFGRERLLASALDVPGWLFPSGREVIVLYGPTGSGKSSFVMGGLRHRLAGFVYRDLSREGEKMDGLHESAQFFCVDQAEAWLFEEKFKLLVDMLLPLHSRGLRILVLLRSESHEKWSRLWDKFVPAGVGLQSIPFRLLDEDEACEILEYALPLNSEGEPLLDDTSKRKILQQIQDRSGGFSPAMLQIFANDVSKRGGNIVRDIKGIWREWWEETIRGDELPMTLLFSFVCPLDYDRYIPRSEIYFNDLEKWFCLNRINSRVFLRNWLKKMTKSSSRWLTEMGEDSYIFTHDLLLEQARVFLEENGIEKRKRRFALKIKNLMKKCFSENKSFEKMLEELETTDLKVLHQNFDMWMHWIKWNLAF